MLKVCLNYQADGHTKFKGNMRADHLILQLTFLWVEEQTYRLVGLVSFEVVFLCLYALIPPFLPLMKAPLEVTFCNSPHLSSRVGLHLFNVIESATSHCFLQLREQEEVAWSKVRGVGRVCGIECCVSPEIHLWWQPCEQRHCHGAGSNCRNATSQGDDCAQHCRGVAGLFW